MRTNTLTAASALSDHDLLSRLDTLAHRERESTADLVAHLAVLESRPSVYLARGYGSLFAYCVEALHLSEDAACARIDAARACRRFPVILDDLASGALSLSTARRLAGHLTAVLARARGRSVRQVEGLVAELAPRPDVAASVRRVPERNQTETAWMERQMEVGAGSAATNERDRGAGQAGCHQKTGARDHVGALSRQRPTVVPSAPRRYRVQFTIGQETHDRLRRLQDLLRREIPDGDAGVILERAVRLLLEKVEREKLGMAMRPREAKPAIRRATDKGAGTSGRPVGMHTGTPQPPAVLDIRTPGLPSRGIPAHVQRVVWARDGGRCAFISADGHRCTETSFLEFHHREPWARRGPATIENIALRCRRHNQYEATLRFGPEPPRLRSC